MARNDSTTALCEQVSHAFNTRQSLRITEGNSKSFYGRKVEGEEISVAGHTGILEYRASELVLTARSGTKLSEIESTLAENRQMLAYEPPLHDPNSTLGGSIACGLSGPRRPYAGAARDFVLGTTIINGKGELLKFGGQVMKNVAGYDASRLMTGAQGTLAWYATYVTGQAVESWFAKGKSWGSEGPKETINEILGSLDQDSILQSARTEIVGKLRKAS